MKFKKYIYLFLIFVSIQILTLYVINYNQQLKIETLLKNESNLMKTHYSSIYSDFEKLANTVFHGYINKPVTPVKFDEALAKLDL